MPAKDPDANVVAIFKNLPQQNEKKSAAAGRPIFDDREVVEMRFSGSRNVVVQPATAFSHWAVGLDGEQVKVTYAERFARQYQQFKAHATQTKSGTPLAHAPFLTEARRAELRALNIYTVEQLAAIDGHELKNLGQGGREFKNKAIEYIEDSKGNNTQLIAELEALRAKTALLEEDNARLKEGAGEGEFENMTLDQLREYITANTGHAPVGQMNRKTLIRMANEARPSKVA